MTNEEAVERLTTARLMLEARFGGMQVIMSDAFDLAIEALKQYQEPCDDEDGDTFSQCEECGQFYLDNRGYDYCPNCGKRLESE